jgi:hypothetical protein
MARANPQPKQTLFDLSFRGGLSELLRAIAEQLEEHTVKAEAFEWKLTEDRLEFTARIDMKPKEGV